MRGKAEAKQKYCGNCGYHNTYDYPNLILCWARFSENKNPIVKTLYCCDHWDSSSQECHCVEEALKERGGK